MLTAVPEAYFSSLFSGDWQQVLTAEGEVFVDRDGEVNRCFPGDCVVTAESCFMRLQIDVHAEVQNYIRVLTCNT